MGKNYMAQKSFRYRTPEKEENRSVLVTTMNQNSLWGFDISNMTENQITNLRTKWEVIQGNSMTLPEKEKHIISNYRPAKGSFRTFKTSRIRYFHTGN